MGCALIVTALKGIYEILILLRNKQIYNGFKNILLHIDLLFDCFTVLELLLRKITHTLKLN